MQQLTAAARDLEGHVLFVSVPGPVPFCPAS